MLQKAQSSSKGYLVLHGSIITDQIFAWRRLLASDKHSSEGGDFALHFGQTIYFLLQG